MVGGVSADSDGKKIKPAIELNQDKIDEDLKFAGYNMIVTSEINMKDEDVYNTYHNLWKIEDFNEQIDKLYLEWQLIDALNLILSEPQKYFHNAQHELSTKLNRIKVPRIVAEKFQPNLKDIFQAFDSIKKNSVKNFEQAINQIKTFAAQFKEFFDNQFLTLPRWDL